MRVQAASCCRTDLNSDDRREGRLGVPRPQHRVTGVKGSLPSSRTYVLGSCETTMRHSRKPTPHHSHARKQRRGRRRTGILWEYNGDGQYSFDRIKGQTKRYWRRWSRRATRHSIQQSLEHSYSGSRCSQGTSPVTRPRLIHHVVEDAPCDDSICQPQNRPSSVSCPITRSTIWPNADLRNVNVPPPATQNPEPPYEPPCSGRNSTG